MTDVEKVIRGLECCITDRCEDCPYEDICYGDNEVELFDTLARDALALLKAQEPRVMTLEEVLAIETDHFDRDYYFNPEFDSGIPVWLEYRWMDEDFLNEDEKGDTNIYASILMFGPKVNNDIVGRYDCATSGIDYLDLGNYGRTWRCWTSRPTDAQREAVKWE